MFRISYLVIIVVCLAKTEHFQYLDAIERFQYLDATYATLML